MTTHSKQVMAAYNTLVAEITRDVRRLQEEYGRLPCPTDCFKCCRNTATMPISEVEGRDLKRGLDALPQQIRLHIRQKADRTIAALQAAGHSQEKMLQDSGMDAIKLIKGTPIGECPMLIGGVCSVYEHRPVICRVWGYPIDNGGELSCCHKTFIGQRQKFKPIDYSSYWRRCKTLSEALGATQKTPNCHLVSRLIET